MIATGNRHSLLFSSPEFPENRENNSEFAVFLTRLTIFDIKSYINFNGLHTNSLHIRTGNVFRRNRELIRRNRE